MSGSLAEYNNLIPSTAENLEVSVLSTQYSDRGFSNSLFIKEESRDRQVAENEKGNNIQVAIFFK